MKNGSYKDADSRLGVVGFVSVFAVARQAKLMKQRVGMEDDEEEEKEEKERAVWGRGKKIYYGADSINREVRSFNVSESLVPAIQRFWILFVVVNFKVILGYFDFESTAEKIRLSHLSSFASNVFCSGKSSLILAMRKLLPKKKKWPDKRSWNKLLYCAMKILSSLIQKKRKMLMGRKCLRYFSCAHVLVILSNL